MMKLIYVYSRPKNSAIATKGFNRKSESQANHSPKPRE